jgi:hypothetical protein
MTFYLWTSKLLVLPSGREYVSNTWCGGVGGLLLVRLSAVALGAHPIPHSAHFHGTLWFHFPAVARGGVEQPRVDCCR